MSCSIVHALLFVLFIFFSFSIPNVIAATSSSSLVKEACSDTYISINDEHFCLKLLRSRPKIVSATNSFDLVIAIIESGISNATDTRRYVENMLKKKNLEPDLKCVLKECNSSYYSAIASFHSALLEVKDHDYMTPSYDLKIGSTDYIDVCQKAVASKQIKDATILIGNKVLPVFGFSGFNVLYGLDVSQPSTSPIII